MNKDREMCGVLETKTMPEKNKIPKKKVKTLVCTSVNGCLNTTLFYHRIITDTQVRMDMCILEPKVVVSSKYFCQSCDGKAKIEKEEDDSEKTHE